MIVDVEVDGFCVSLLFALFWPWLEGFERLRVRLCLRIKSAFVFQKLTLIRDFRSRSGYWRFNADGGEGGLQTARIPRRSCEHDAVQCLWRVERMRCFWVGCGDEGPQVHWRRGHGARVRVVGSGRDVHDAPFGFGNLLHEQEAGRGGRGGLVAADWCVGSAVFELFSF